MGGCGAPGHTQTQWWGWSLLYYYHRSRWKSKATVVSIDRGKEYFRSHSRRKTMFQLCKLCGCYRMFYVFPDPLVKHMKCQSIDFVIENETNYIDPQLQQRIWSTHNHLQVKDKNTQKTQILFPNKFKLRTTPICRIRSTNWNHKLINFTCFK